MTNQTNYISKCCNAPVEVEGEVTHYYVCQKCKQACAIINCNKETKLSQDELAKAYLIKNKFEKRFVMRNCRGEKVIAENISPKHILDFIFEIQNL